VRRIAIGLAVLGLAFGAFYLASPPAAVSGLRDAIARGDTIELGDRVDFTSVRQGLKEQVNARVLGKDYQDLASSPFGSIAIGVASKLLEGRLDSFLTPAGLADLASGRIPGEDERSEQAPSHPPGPEPAEPPAAPFAHARIDRETLGRFSAWVPAEAGGEIRFVFRLQGLGWKLTDIILPPGK